MAFGTSGHGVAYDLDRGIMKSFTGSFGDPQALTGSLSISPAPEPISLAFVAAGLAIIAFIARRRSANI